MSIFSSTFFAVIATGLLDAMFLVTLDTCQQIKEQLSSNQLPVCKNTSHYNKENKCSKKEKHNVLFTIHINYLIIWPPQHTSQNLYCTSGS